MAPIINLLTAKPQTPSDARPFIPALPLLAAEDSEGRKLSSLTSTPPDGFTRQPSRAVSLSHFVSHYGIGQSLLRAMRQGAHPLKATVTSSI